ncbi:MAG: family 16 glycoside hydrolase [Pirellulaceae bacterium]|nr:family 16 glycoside hydrolase [Pirellulaceae bacterium]
MNFLRAQENQTNSQVSKGAADWCRSDFWSTTSGSAPGKNWEFIDGEIRLLDPSGGQGSLLSPPLPVAFDLSFQWKIEEKSNSGVKYRVRQFGNRWLGVEYQIIDEPIRRTEPSKNGTASIYDLSPASIERDMHPVGQWNSARVVATSDRVEHYLNGEKVASISTRGPEWEAAVAFSKFYGLPNFGQPTDGDRIMLTDHGGKIAYKDFQLTAIDEKIPPASVQRRAPQLGNAFRNSWADQSSIVLWSRTTAQSEMVKDGPAFIELEKSEVAELSNSMDEQKLVAAQLPKNTTLQQMAGACPGAPGELRLTYFPTARKNQAKVIAWKATNAESDFTMQWQLQDLQPGTEYAAIIETRRIGEEAITAVVRGSFQTAPRADKPADVSFCVTTCHDFVRRDDGENGHKIYVPLAQLGPNFIVHAGDIEYYDLKRPWGWTKDLMRFKWARLFSLPRNRDFYANTTTYFIKDDHDTLKDDCSPGQRYGAVTFEEGMKLFNEEQFPSHSPRYHTVVWGEDLQIWTLEGRDFRSSNKMPDGPDKSILGAEQKRWLLETLGESKAAFKLVFSPTPIVGPDRTNKHDNHSNDNFAHEGNELRQQFSQIPGAIVFCGDRHWQYASIDPANGLWEFGCGPGSEAHDLGWKEDDVRPEHQFLRVASGFLSGRVTHAGKKEEPSLTIRHHKISGEQVSEFVFPVK